MRGNDRYPHGQRRAPSRSPTSQLMTDVRHEHIAGASSHQERGAPLRVCPSHERAHPLSSHGARTGLSMMINRPHPLAESFRQKILNAKFPCLGAKSALTRKRMQITIARDITSSWNDLTIFPKLIQFAKRYKHDPKPFQSFVVIFEGPRALSEVAFERALWARIQSLTDKDAWAGNCRDPRVSSDPKDAQFSLSFGGEAFFAVGLHPRSSRPARRFVTPAIVFNLHAQFEQLRELGQYEKLRAAILARDLLFSGSANPMLARHGQTSEARQYSGRRVTDDWLCPYREWAGQRS
jgi:uncharacterized protein